MRKEPLQARSAGMDPASSALDTDIRARRVDASGPVAEWDGSEWVGEGQEPPGFEPLRLPPAEPRWTKWQWIGEGQGPAGPRRGLPAAAMDDVGGSGPSGHCHNPGVEHWAWTVPAPI